MMVGPFRSKGCVTAVVLAVAALAGGCSAGDVELNGSVFDKLGVGSNSKSADNNPQVPIRQGLVVPPSLDQLPRPGSGEEGAQTAEALPVNPEQRRKTIASDAMKQHKAFCEKALMEAKVQRDYRQVNGPLGRCDASVLDSVAISSPFDVKTGSNPPPKTQ